METLTIFTPTYNRAKFLPRAFEALKRQTLKDFLWMIIDDGSTDNTEEVVQDLLKDTEAGFKIEYVKKENGGLHTGYNKAIELAQTELMVCVDSDDYIDSIMYERLMSQLQQDGADISIDGGRNAKG